MVMNNFTRAAVMPTRITANNATSNDHIYYTNGGKSELGIL